MKVISKYGVSKEMVHKMKMPLEDFSKKLRIEIMGQMVVELSERMPVNRYEQEDFFAPQYNLETEFYVYTRDQMEKLVKIAKSLPVGKKKEMLEWLASDIDKIEDLNLFPEVKQVADEVKPNPDENLVAVPKKKGRPKKKG